MGLSRTGYPTQMLAVVALGPAIAGLLCSGWARQQWSNIFSQRNVANTSTAGNERSEGAGSAFTAEGVVSAGEAAPFRQERNRLLMLGAMSYVYIDDRERGAVGGGSLRVTK